MKKLLVSIVGTALVVSLAFPIGTFAWADDPEEITEEASASAFNEGELEAALSYELSDSTFALQGDEGIVAEDDAVEPQTDTVDEAVEVTPGWEASGTCEWQITRDMVFRIRPIPQCEVGEVGIPTWRVDYVDGDTQNSNEKFDKVKAVKEISIEGPIKVIHDMLFYGFRAAENINGCEYLDTSGATSLSCMFLHCDSLESIDVSGFDTSNVKDFSLMFSDCLSLASLDVASFDTSKATNLQGMFAYCQSLDELDLSRFDTSNVTYMDGVSVGPMGLYAGGMFAGCTSLKKLDISSFNTRKSDIGNVDKWGSNYIGIFQGCDTLYEVKVGKDCTLQSCFPSGVWFNTKGQQFYPEGIPVGVADTYTSTAPHVSIKVPEGASTALEVGNELQLSAEVFPSTLASSLVWSSSDDGVASVDGAGKVTAKAAGTATITVKAGDLSDSITVTVKAAGAPEVAVESVTLDKTSMTLVGQEMRALSATVLPADATYKNVVWSSSDESVARVSAQGSVMAVGKGSATITVRSSDGEKSATCVVEVRNPVTWAGFSSVPTKVCVSKDYRIKVSARGDLPGETDGFTTVAWSSSDSAIAKVTGSGTEGSVKGVAPGSCTIHASAVRDGKTFDLAEQIEVEWDLIESITLSEASKSIQVGASGFTLEYGISNPSAAGRLGEIRWSASGIADIQGGNGVLTITPKRTGHEVVALWGPGVSAQFDLTVTPKVVSVSDDSDVEGVLHVNDSETAAYVGDAHLRIKDSAEKANHDLIQLAVGSAGGISAMLDAYDIDLVDEEGIVVPLEGASDAVTVFVKMDDPIKTLADTHDLGVHYIDAMNGKAEAKDTWVDGEMLAFETTHFSTYAITATQRPTEATNDPVKNDAAVESALAQTGDVMGMVLDGAACAALLGLVSLTILSALRRRWGMH